MLIDYGGADATTLIAGMGRSGATWVADVVNYDRNHRGLFEPFLPHQVKEARPFKNIHCLPPPEPRENQCPNVKWTPLSRQLF